MSFDEKQLLALLAQGSEYAFTELFSRYRGKVYNLASKFLRSNAMAEEVVQDVFLKCWLKRSEMTNIDNLDAYLKTITKNIVLNLFRKKALESDYQQSIIPGGQQVDNTDHRLREHQYQDILQAALAKLPPQQKEVYRLARAEGLSHEEIAERMHISRATVKSHMARALQYIRKYINESMLIVSLILAHKNFF
ncbi:hypothetical protein COR50_02155 [Chitinophaga caeni]|uniref:HTH luxR-type domain-containing protein n=1 Tax=Chitinophaga caeni TaxID=2029983 RepID=A0A291QQ28_9BACT|nr:RNA polymerase sigma-70 factor [Chitinophaga caeni]ATL46060.1 hypothetical protein COR50_02155 [Chitinophaga caeni]